MASRSPRSFPIRGNQEALSYLLTLDRIRLQADSLFEDLEKGVFGSVVNLYLFIVVGRLLCNRAEPVVGHFSGDRGAAIPGRHSRWPGHLDPRASRGKFPGWGGADVVPDDHTRNELLPHPFRRPLRLATPSEEAVIGLALDVPGPHRFGQAMGRGEDEGITGGRTRSLTWFCRCLRRRLGSSSCASTAGVVARCWRRVLFCVCFANYIIRLGEVGCMFHGHEELLVLITILSWGDRGKVLLLPSKHGTQSHFFHGYESFNPFKPL